MSISGIPEEFIAEQRKKYPLGRIGSVNEVNVLFAWIYWLSWISDQSECLVSN